MDPGENQGGQARKTRQLKGLGNGKNEPAAGVNAPAPVVKPDPYALPQGVLVKRQDDAPKDLVLNPRTFYKVYETVDDIPYTPEGALKEGLGMVDALKASIKRIDLGSKLRHDVWNEEIRKCVQLLGWS